MGTNYYLHEKPPCECCGRPYAPLHIGKSSAGWCFSLHVYPDDGIRDLPDWVERWSQPGTYILDEYNGRVPPEEMYLCITERHAKLPWPPPFVYEQNRAVSGPNGLLRCQITPNFCIGHGAGTWDLLVADFS